MVMPGDHLVMTGAAAQSHWNPIVPTINMENLNLLHCYAMTVDKVIFFGEPLALVVAASAHQAEDAARAVVVKYEDLPVDVDAEQAAAVSADGVALIYPAWKTNLQSEPRFSHGDVDGAFASADLVIDELINSHRFGAMPMETRVVLARVDRDDESLVLRRSTQIPHQTRMYLSKVFGIAETRIQVLADDAGGGFGAKLSVDSEYLPALASTLLGRAVLWFESRSEWMHADPAERGAGLGMPLNGSNHAPGPCRVSNYRSHVRCVVTNKRPYSAYRGYGEDLANMLIERVLDQTTDRLEIDPVEIRKRNLPTHYPHQIVTGPVIEQGSNAMTTTMPVARSPAP